MMVPGLLAELRARNIQIRAEGEQLRCNAPAGALTPELREQLQLRKGDILEFLRSASALARQQRAIVPLQPQGKRTPIFAVAGHNGDVFCYRFLAQHLGLDQPLYGLEPPGRDGQSEPLTRVEDLAAYFAGQIRAFRPAGPCIIAGFCAGGSIAFELARQLLQARVEVRLLALFGAPFPTAYWLLPQWRNYFRLQIERVVRHTRALASLSSGERRSYLAERLRNYLAQRSAGRPAAADAVLLLRAKVERVTIAAARRYTPGHFPGRVNLFLPCRQWVHSGNEPLRWRTQAQHTREYFGPDGCTTDLMLRESYAPTFANLLKECLREECQIGD
jgi:thioesterase domain-containing protein